MNPGGDQSMRRNKIDVKLKKKEEEEREKGMDIQGRVNQRAIETKYGNCERMKVKSRLDLERGTGQFFGLKKGSRKTRGRDRKQGKSTIEANKHSPKIANLEC